jgi:Tfp pilus assembly pilus retraction ATPase PilT
MQLTVSEQAEALHLYPGEAPVLEVRRALHRLEGPKLKPNEVDDLLRVIITGENLSEFAFAGMVSFYHHFADAAVFHVMAFRGDSHVRLEIRRFR